VILGPNIFCNLQICDLRSQLFCGLKTFTNPQLLYFSPYKYIPKCSNLNFYQIKKFCQTNLLPTFSKFCYKGREKKIFCSLCLMVQNLRICNLWTVHLRNL
jgi:hypothetical protein